MTISHSFFLVLLLQLSGLGLLSAAEITVTNEVDLRAALFAAATEPGCVIRFDSSLDGGTITLTEEDLDIANDTENLVIDASDLAGGVRIDADASENDRRRVLTIGENAIVTLNNIIITGGWTADGVDSFEDDGVEVGNGGNGGGISVGRNTTLNLISTTVVNNLTGNGGDRFGNGVGGCGGFGGGIYVFTGATLTLTSCMVAENSTGNGGSVGMLDGSGQHSWSGDGGDGGGIHGGERATLTLTSSMVVANSTGNGSVIRGDGFSGSGGSGGGISVDSSATLTLISTTVTENLTGNSGSTSNDGSRSFGNNGGLGGGIYTRQNATVTLTSSAMTENSTGNGGTSDFDSTSGGSGGFGGGIYLGSSSALTLTFTTIADNSTGNGGSDGGNGGYGGGIWVGSNSELTLNSSMLMGNSTGNGGADGYGGPGGGIYALSAPTLTLNSSTIAENSTGAGGNGGGIYIYLGGSLTLTSSTVAKNSTGNGGNDGGFGGDGGGIYLERVSTTLTLSSTTVSENLTGNGGNGGGIRISSSPNNVTIENSIVAGNSAAGSDNNIEGTINNEIGANLLSGDPLLAPLGNYGGPTQTTPPLPGSPAINAAIGSTIINDQRGFAITDGSSDIGASEYLGVNDTLLLPLIWNTDGDGDGVSLGVEFVLGTDPNLTDLENPNHLSLSFDSGRANLNFGVNADAVNQTLWSLQRSTDLSNWTTLFQASPGTSIPSAFPIIDENEAANSKVFYRIVAPTPQ